MSDSSSGGIRFATENKPKVHQSDPSICCRNLRVFSTELRKAIHRISIGSTGHELAGKLLRRLLAEDLLHGFGDEGFDGIRGLIREANAERRNHAVPRAVALRAVDNRDPQIGRLAHREHVVVGAILGPYPHAMIAESQIVEVRGADMVTTWGRCS